MPNKRDIRCLLLPTFLVLVSLLSACQSPALTDQAQACNPKSLPVVKTLEPVQASSQIVYATSGPNLYAFNAGNGALRWCSKISLGNELDEFDSVARSGANVYAYTEAGNTTAFNAHSGKLVWSTDTGNIYTDFVQGIPPPSIVNNTIYGGTRSIYALNTQDGSVRWHYSFPSHGYAEFVPVVSNGDIYFSANALQNIYALDAATGNKSWVLSLNESTRVFGQLAAGEGVVAFPYQKASSDGGINFGLDVVNAQNGRLLWQKALGSLSSMIVANGLLYVAGYTPDNSVDAVEAFYAFDIRTGSVRWSLTNKIAADNPFLVTNNVLYTFNGSGEITALNALTGQLLWHGQLQLSSKVLLPSRLTLLDDELFVETKDADFAQHPTFYLHAFNINTQQEDWYANITGIETSAGSMYSVGG